MPFRQTMAYRMILLTLSILLFVWTLYEMTVSLMANSTLAFIIAAVTGVLAAITVFYNLDHLRDAKIPAATARRLKRR